MSEDTDGRLKDGIFHIYPCTGPTRSIPIRRFGVKNSDSQSATVTYVKKGRREGRWPDEFWFMSDFDDPSYAGFVAYVTVEDGGRVVYDSREHLTYDMDKFAAQRAISDAQKANTAVIEEIKQLYGQSERKHHELIKNLMVPGDDDLNYAGMYHADAQWCAQHADQLKRDAAFFAEIARNALAYWESGASRPSDTARDSNDG